jgi:uncharacterized membrane protein HdeD (DUF308 family)
MSDQQLDKTRIMIPPEEARLLGKSWGWFMAAGVGFVIVGTLAVILPFVAALALELTLGVVLVVAGVFQIAHGFVARAWRGAVLQVFAGILYLLVGILLLANPLEGVLTLTVLLGVFFVLDGGFKVGTAFKWRPRPNWGWLMVNGVVSLVLALLILAGLPGTALWALGLLLGINFIFNGWTMIVLAVSIKNAA